MGLKEQKYWDPKTLQQHLILTRLYNPFDPAAACL